MNDFTKSVNEEKTRKRLGQYFTNDRVADLLVSVADMQKDCKCIDPMAGTGNMLAALLNNGQKEDSIYAIEIDQIAGGICKNRIKKDNMIISDAFDKKTYANLPKGGWDLVITNPPYIRYQSMGNNQSADIELPTAKQIRKNLQETIETFAHLDATDKKLYKHLVKSYSGLSDVAVPAWILCAALVRPGGKLAVVVPSTWLNREYATIIQYMLLKWFDIEYVIEDGDCSWFSDALVRTEIIVARRIKRRNHFLDVMEKTFISIKLCEKAAGKNNLIENMFKNCPQTLGEFLNFTRTKEFENDCCSIKKEKIKSMFSNVLCEAGKNKWFNLVEDLKISEASTLNLPSVLANLLKIERSECKLISLEQIGVYVGQGLRTGANKFFYLKSLGENGDSEKLVADEQFDSTMLSVPKKYLYPVVQKQNDLPDKFEICKHVVAGRVLYIQNAATSFDLDKANESTKEVYETLNTDLENYISKAQSTPIRSGANCGKFIPFLSAVIPNVRIVKKQGKELKRFWYMLPCLAERHIPDFCVARINYNSPVFYILTDRNIVVDANFSTLWINDLNKKNKYAILAILNSYWFRACLEAMGTTMGGGALKVEAVKIKKVTIPELEERDYCILNEYGRNLSRMVTNSNERANFVGTDQLLLQRIFNKTDISSELSSLMSFVESNIRKRKKEV